MKKKQYYNFTLILDGVDINTPNLEDILFEAGCDDAFLSSRNDTIYLEFDREAENLEDAVLSAIHDIENCPLKPTVIHVTPETHVPLAEIASRLNTNRQIVSLWISGKRRKNTNFPKPIMYLSSKSTLWKWSAVVKWLFDQELIDDIAAVEQAEFLDHLNASLEERDIKVRQYRNRLLKKLAA